MRWRCSSRQGLQPLPTSGHDGAASSRPAVQPAATSDPDAEAALRRLRADADGAVKVHRDDQGGVDFVRSADGAAMVEARSRTTPARTATDQLSRYGDAFGIDGDTSRAVVEQTLPSATGGSVVRAEQVVDGVPVFGGQVVMSLDEDHGVVSVDAATTDATQVPRAEVSEAKAEQVALGITARTHRVAAGTLTADRKGRVLYDPAIVHTVDPLGDPAGLAVRGGQRPRHPRDGADRHRPTARWRCTSTTRPD